MSRWEGLQNSNTQPRNNQTKTSHELVPAYCNKKRQLIVNFDFNAT